MRFDNEFKVQAPIDEAWNLLVDVPKIATCLPGATVHGSDGDEFQGSVAIKVGPIKVGYQGVASMAEVDAAERRFVLDARGKEGGGRGSVNADITVQLHEDGANSTLVKVTTEVDVTGKVAQFGRSAMADVGERLIGQFAANLEAMFIEKPADGVASSAEQSSSAPVAASSGASEMDAMALLAPLVKRAAPSVGAFVIGAISALVLRRLFQRTHA